MHISSHMLWENNAVKVTKASIVQACDYLIKVYALSRFHNTFLKLLPVLSSQ